jgi:hypothetical protein
MPATTTPAGRRPARKSPLRVATELQPLTLDEPDADSAGARRGPERHPAELSPRDLRRLMISEYRDWLRSRTNRHGRPFQDETVSAYADAAIALDAWMTREGIEEDFTACDTAMLNRFFAAYFAAHGQGGTNTKQRNLRHLFTWLERDHDHPHPYTDDLQRYTPAKGRPSTLAGQFIKDLLEATGNGRARDFEAARDHAMIRMLTEGVRRTELIQQHTCDLPVDVIAQPFVRVVPLKGARNLGQQIVRRQVFRDQRALLASGTTPRWARPEELADDPERIPIREALAFGKALYDIRTALGPSVGELAIRAPGVVHQQVEVAVLPPDLLEQLSDLRIDGVIAAHRHRGPAPPDHLLRRLLDAARTSRRGRPATCAAPGDVHGRAAFAEHGCDPAARAAARSGHYRDDSIKRGTHEVDISKRRFVK